MSKADGKYGGDNPPTKRGRSFKNKLIDVIREESMLPGIVPSSCPKKAEVAFIKKLAERAFDDDDQHSGTLLKELLGKSYASVKATLPSFDFDFDKNASPSVQVMQLIDAASDGHIPADVAAIFINAVKNAVDIQISTDIKSRLEALEAIVNI